MSKAGVAGRDSRDQGRLQSGDRLARLNNDVSEVTSLLRDNVEKIVERGEKISNLHDRSEDLASNSQKFTYSAREVRKKMCYQNYRLTAIIVVVVLIVIGIIVVIILAGTKTI
ncbi:hypothetical protein CHS0354_036117 [Potamilus streckersoni]|uniref:V-SNARE coiled-coil homology domain-containing protein n=1 Tax=Potamilus streckersoni TaxID=2493646 RepID=A0AAE0W6T0_9BIVA|nr:hypothetical protein CHS0354_036117 [Potamilus streckersoni]